MKKVKLVIWNFFYGEDYILEIKLDKDSPLLRDEPMYVRCPYTNFNCISGCAWFNIEDGKVYIDNEIVKVITCKETVIGKLVEDEKE